MKGRQPPRAVMITGRVGNGLLLVARPGTYTGDAIELAGGRFALARPWRDCPGLARGDSQMPIPTCCSMPAPSPTATI